MTLENLPKSKIARVCKGCKATIIRYRSNEKKSNPRYLDLCRQCAPDVKIRNLPDELVDAIVSGAIVDYIFYRKYKDLYSSKSLKVKFDCENCGASHTSDFKHLNKRKVVTGAFCPKCVMKESSSDTKWRERNSKAQLKIQSTPEQRKKNAEAVSRFWRENPEKLKQMGEKVREAQNRPEVREKYKNRESWNGRGISGDYLSKWGWMHFDSSYELAFLIHLEGRVDVKHVKRGPIIEYDFDGVNKLFFVDFDVEMVGRKIWCEVKSGYIGKKIEKVDKLREKLRKAISLVKEGHADEIVLVTEKSARERFGFDMPRGTYRAAMFRNMYSKIMFANKKHEDKYK